MAASAGSVTRDLAGRRIRSQQGEEERAETASGHVQYHQHRVAAAAASATAPASAAANLISFEIYDFELFGQGCLSQSQSQSVWVALNYFVCLKFLRFFDELTLPLPQRVAQCGRCCSCSSNSCCRCCCCCWLNLICVFAKALTFLCCPLITHSQSSSCSVRIYS